MSDFHAAYLEQGPLSVDLVNPAEVLVKLNKSEHEFDTL